jgi:hypothetical protein
MKLVNSKDIKKIVEDKSDPGDLYDFLEDELKSPCWQVNVDREDGKLRFLIDSKELMNYPLSKIDDEDINLINISEWLQILRLEDSKLLKNKLKSIKKRKGN